MANKLFTAGQVRDIPKNVEETRTIPFVISDPSRDRHDTVLSRKGWDIASYNQNGIVGYMHNVMGGGMCDEPDPDFVIGKGIAAFDNDLLIGNATFEPADINDLAEKIFRKVIFGSLRSTSVGFIETTPGKYGYGNEAMGQPDETYYIGNRELLEFSVVNIPSNRNAQVRSMRDMSAGALNYVRRELGHKFRLSQIENMRVCDVLDLLDGKDLEIRTYDPDEIRALMCENVVLRDHIERLQRAYKLKK